MGTSFLTLISLVENGSPENTLPIYIKMWQKIRFIIPRKKYFFGQQVCNKWTPNQELKLGHIFLYFKINIRSRNFYHMHNINSPSFTSLNDILSTMVLLDMPLDRYVTVLDTTRYIPGKFIDWHFFFN